MSQENKYSALHRFLHWTIAIGMAVLLFTGFLRMTWMDKKHMAGIMGKHFSEISSDQLIDAAEAIRTPMWEWHIIFAYVVFGAFLIRIIYMLLKGIRFPKAFGKDVSLIERLQGMTYIIFYLFLAFSIFSGAMIEWGAKSDFRNAVKAIHKMGLYFYPAFIFVHLLGVYIDEKFHKKNATSKMIGGE